MIPLDFVLVHQGFSFISIIGIVVLGLTAFLLVNIKYFLIQLVCLVASGFISSLVILTIYAILQVLFGLFIVYKCKKQSDYNYQLILEKTHQVPKKYTQNGSSGDKHYNF